MCWPSKINKQQLQIAYEAFFNNINKNCAITEANADNIKTTLKSHFNKFLSHKEKHKSKIKEHINNLKSLAKEKSIYVSKFDKGQGVCIINKDTYINKMNALLSDNTKFKVFSCDKRVKNDPFIYFEEKYNRTAIKKLL